MPDHAVHEGLPLKSIHAHLSTLDFPSQMRAYAALADFAGDHLGIAAARTVRGFVPSAVQLSWCRAQPSQCDQPPVSELTIDCADGTRIPVPLHDELDHLDLVIPPPFAGLLPVELEDVEESDREEVLVGQLAAGLGLDEDGYRTLLHAANLLVERNPHIERLPLQE